MWLWVKVKTYWVRFGEHPHLSRGFLGFINFGKSTDEPSGLQEWTTCTVTCGNGMRTRQKSEEAKTEAGLRTKRRCTRSASERVFTIDVWTWGRNDCFSSCDVCSASACKHSLCWFLPIRYVVQATMYPMRRPHVRIHRRSLATYSQSFVKGGSQGDIESSEGLCPVETWSFALRFICLTCRPRKSQNEALPARKSKESVQSVLVILPSNCNVRQHMSTKLHPPLARRVTRTSAPRQQAPHIPSTSLHLGVMVGGAGEAYWPIGGRGGFTCTPQLWIILGIEKPWGPTHHL